MYGADTGKDHRFLLVDADGLILFDNQKQLHGQTLAAEIKGTFRPSAALNSQKVRFQGTESVITSYTPDLHDLGEIGWSIVSVTPWPYVAGQIELVMKWVAAIMSVILLSALLFTFALVKRNILFILHLVGSMKRVERSDMTVRIEARRKDETTTLQGL